MGSTGLTMPFKVRIMHQLLIRGLLLLAASLSLSAQAGSATWPMFRGNPALTGVSDAALPSRLKLAWSFKTQGPVKSSAAIANGKVFIGSNDGHLYAFDSKSGSNLWRFKTEGPVESSPLVLNNMVYIGSSDGALYAVNMDGKQVWKYVTGDKILASPNFVNVNNSARIVIGGYDYKLHCLDAATGKSNWVYETGNYINGSPAVFDGKTVFGGCDALLHVLSLADGQKVKEVEAGAYIAASVAIKGPRAYVGHYENEFLCIDLEKGTNAWTYRDKNFAYFSSPAVTEDKVIFGGRDKKVHCVNLADGKQAWTFATRGKVDSSPAVCGDKVIVGSDDGRLYVLNLKSGKETWSYEIGPPVASSPAVIDGTVIVGADDGGVYAFTEGITK
jgi:eukaryotic-like serine/threonine-protein kinase